MFGQRFQHLFPSPGLRTDSFKEIVLGDRQKERKNLHLNAESLKRPPLDVRKFANSRDDAKKTFSRNRNAFVTSVGSLEKIRRSLTPTIRRKGENSLSKHRIPVKNEKGESEVKQKQIELDLYEKIFLFKDEQDETPMIFIKGKVDIYTDVEGAGGILVVHKLNNYTEKQHNCLSCRIVSTKNFIKKNQLNLLPSEYEVVMAGFISKLIEPRSTNKEIQVRGKWFPPPPTHSHLTLILRDEIQGKILFTTNCFSFDQIIEKTLNKHKANSKVY